jgi:hypothetical protein
VLGRQQAVRIARVAPPACLAAVLLADLTWWMTAGPAPLRILGVELPVGRFEAEAAIAALLLVAALVLAGGFRAPSGTPLAAAGLTAAVLLANTLPIGSGDTVPATFLPFAIVREGRLTFERSGLDVPLGIHGGVLPYYLVPVGSRVASKYSPAMGVLATPVYLPAVLGRFDPGASAVLHLGKLAAVLLTALGAGCLFAAARNLVGTGWAWVATALHVLATPVLSVLGQALWQHTGAALGLSVALLALTLPGRESRSVGLLAGIGLGLTVACRPVDMVLALGVAVAVLRERRRAVPWMVVTALLPVVLLGLYQWRVFGSPLATGYGAEAREGWTTPLHEGLPGLLISPARGLLLHAPILLLGAGALLPRSRAPGWLVPPVLAFALFTVLMGRWWAWTGGYAAGNRMLSDGLPILSLAMACGLPAVWSIRSLRPPVVALAVVSIATAAALTFVRPGKAFRDRVLELERGPWEPASHPLVALTRQLEGADAQELR